MGERRRLFSALSIGCAVLVATPSWAAVVEPGYGDLTINQGQGFKPVTSGTNANVGDAVRAAAQPWSMRMAARSMFGLAL
jgi:hypothetical protein